MNVLTAVLLASLNFAPLDAEIERLMTAGNVPGAAVVVVEDGKVTHARGFGVTSVETKVPVTTGTLFRIGSTTKMFVALAALKLDLQRPIGELVPDLPPALRPLTLHQLLTHTAGLRDDAPMNGPLEESALEARIRSWDERVFFTKPGEVMSYSNPGYVLAGYVIARASGKPFGEAMREQVLHPVGMTSSTFRPLEAMTRSLAVGHERAGVIRPFAEHAANYPPGSLFTSADDLGRFLSSAPFERLTASTVPVEGRGIRYGYGVMVRDQGGSPVILHTGARSGYGSIIAVLPQQKTAVAILANRTSAVFSGAASALLDQIAKPSPPEPEAEVAIGADEIRTLVGTYVNSEMIRLTLARDGDGLAAQVGGKSLAVKKTGTNRYRLAPGAPIERFVIRDQYLCADMHALRKQE